MSETQAEATKTRIQKFHELTERMKNRLSIIFFRDVYIPNYQIILLIIRVLILAALLTFWVYLILHGISSFIFTLPEQVLIFTLFGLILLFGGMVIDYFVKMRYLFEILAFISIVPMILMLYLDVPILIITVAIVLGGLDALITIIIFSEIVRNTNLLNRGRIATFLSFVLGVAMAPLIALIIIVQSFTWVWILVIVITLISLWYTHRAPIEPPSEKIKSRHILNFKEYFGLVGSTGAIPYFLFILFTSTVLGFYIVNTVLQNFGLDDILIVIFAGVLSFPIVAALLDNYGRKWMAYLIIILVGVISIFSDYPESVFFNLGDIRLAVFSFSALTILILTIVIAGDASTHFSQGRIMGVFLFAAIIGMIFGSFLSSALVTTADLKDQNFAIRMSDWITFVIFISSIFLPFARDSFQSHTPSWRRFLNRMYIVAKNGTALYAVDFKRYYIDIQRANKGKKRNLSTQLTELFKSQSANPLEPIIDEKENSANADAEEETDSIDAGKMEGDELNEDLVSGGLSGLNIMLKEIANSDQNIQVLDHGDLQLIFHFGENSMAVLFVEMNLNVFQEKLANFHAQFEYLNQNVLRSYSGRVSSLIGIPLLMKRFFQ